MDYGLESIPNGFQVLRLTNEGNWNKIIEVDQPDWVPLEIKWVNESEFIIKTTSVEFYIENGPEIKENLDFKRYKIIGNKLSEIIYNIN